MVISVMKFGESKFKDLKFRRLVFRRFEIRRIKKFGDLKLIFQFSDFLSRIPTIPELKRYKSEIVIKEVEEDEGGSSSDSSSDGEAD